MKIFDNREAFYQWDLNQKITSEDFKIGDEVHFGNARSGEALVVKTYLFDGVIVADVPNILLQKAQKIYAYQYVTNGEREYTANETVFPVTVRPKPADYVYTETDLVTVKKLVADAIERAKESGEFKGEKGDKGDPYVLTESDKTSIVNAVLSALPDNREVAY